MEAEIKVNRAGRGSLILGGIDLSNVTTGFCLRSAPGQTELVIDTVPREMTAEADVDVVLPEAMFALLVKLGWTPPTAGPAPADDERG